MGRTRTHYQPPEREAFLRSWKPLEGQQLVDLCHSPIRKKLEERQAVVHLLKHARDGEPALVVGSICRDVASTTEWVFRGPPPHYLRIMPTPSCEGYGRDERAVPSDALEYKIHYIDYQTWEPSSVSHLRDHSPLSVYRRRDRRSDTNLMEEQFTEEQVPGWFTWMGSHPPFPLDATLSGIGMAPDKTVRDLIAWLNEGKPSPEPSARAQLTALLSTGCRTVPSILVQQLLEELGEP